MTGAAKKRPIKAAREAAQKAMMWLWIKRADLFGCYWKAWMLPCFHPRLGRWVMMMGDPKHPMTPGYITEDAYQEMSYSTHSIASMPQTAKCPSFLPDAGEECAEQDFWIQPDEENQECVFYYC